MFLVDTNIWLVVFLKQEKAEESRKFLETVESDLLAITEFSLYSICIILTRLVTIQVSEKPVQLNIIQKDSRRGAIVFKSSHDMLPLIGNPLFH